MININKKEDIIKISVIGGSKIDSKIYSLGYARNILVVLSSHAVIAIDGSSGTLSEIAYALTFNKPVIGLKTWEIRPSSSEITPDIIRAKTPKEAVKLAIKEAKEYVKKIIDMPKQ